MLVLKQVLKTKRKTHVTTVTNAIPLWSDHCHLVEGQALPPTLFNPSACKLGEPQSADVQLRKEHAEGVTGHVTNNH